MKVFVIKTLAKPKDRRFREFSILAADDKVWNYITPHGEGLNGKPFGKNWKVQTFYIEKPLIPKPDFFWIGARAFVCNEKARELVGESMEMYGEFLTIEVEGEKGKYWIYNITNILNVLDE